MTSKIHQLSHLSSNHENRDTRIVLHTLHTTAVGNKRNVDKCPETNQGIRCVYTVTALPQGLQY